MINIIQKGTANNYTWHNLTEGQILCIARLAKAESHDNPVANDTYHEALNFFYTHNKNLYDLLNDH